MKDRRYVLYLNPTQRVVPLHIVDFRRGVHFGVTPCFLRQNTIDLLY